MSIRRRFSGDKTIQETAALHKVHPNQVRTR